MKTKNKKSFFNNSPLKLFLLLGLSSLFIGLVYALGLVFPATPATFTSNGSFNTRFTNIVGSCTAGTFLKGFDANYNRICVGPTGTYTGPALSPAPTSTPGTYPAGVPTGQISGGMFA
ncbi:MAG: hypothetical protein WC774_00295, partial [Candidatus Gracilibacteria bacterium]